MQDTSGITNFDTIVGAGDYSVESKLVINGVDYDESQIYSLKTTRQLFTNQNPTIGNAVVGRLDATIVLPLVDIPKAAQIKPYIRVFNDQLTSGWLQKGEFYIYQRLVDSDSGTMNIIAFDAMYRGNQLYPSSSLTWDATSPTAIYVLYEISTIMDIDVEQETKNIIATTNYIIQFPAQYTLRDVLGSIAAMYGGNFIMTNEGKLRLVGFADLPYETYYLVTRAGSPITFGGTRILLRSVS